MERKIITIDVGDMSPRDAEVIMRLVTERYYGKSPSKFREFCEFLGIAGSFGAFNIF